MIAWAAAVTVACWFLHQVFAYWARQLPVDQASEDLQVVSGVFGLVMVLAAAVVIAGLVRRWLA